MTDSNSGERNQRKSYLDLFLDNSNPKKRGIYFGVDQERAIIKYNNAATTDKEKNILFETTIIPAFRKTISGVLEMKMFHNLGKLNRDEVIDATFFRLIEKIQKFQPGMIGKAGNPVKAYSYFSTIAKNYILELKVRNERILKNKADVETSIDLSILSEDTLEKMSNYNKHEVEFDDYESNFSNTKDVILKKISDVILLEEKKEKKDDDLIKIGYCLKYLVEKWDKIEFMKKNEFMRILTLYTGFNQQKVSFLFKRFKLDGLKKSKSNLNKKIRDEDDEDDDDSYYDTHAMDGECAVEFHERKEKARKKSEEEDEIPDHYQINSMEEFEQQLYRHANKKFKPKWRNKK